MARQKGDENGLRSEVKVGRRGLEEGRREIRGREEQPSGVIKDLIAPALQTRSKALP